MLVVDDDPICLLIVERLLRSCLYQVTTCEQAVIALSMLRENKCRFDVVLSDVHMPQMDGFKLLELVRLEMDVPVIMMSANGETSNVMKGISQGACDYLLKPVRVEELRNIWQHVVRKQSTSAKGLKDASGAKDCERARATQSEPESTTLAHNENASCGIQRKRKGFVDEESANEDDENLCAKRQRVVWSVDLHQKFERAINHLGLEQAVPKRILDLMNVAGLTRENVASHLQKYRLYLRKMSGPSIPPYIGPPGSFLNTLDFSNGLPAFQLDGFSQESPLSLQRAQDFDRKPVLQRPNDVDMHVHLGATGPLMLRSGTAWPPGQLRYVTEASSDSYLQQDLKMPILRGSSWNERHNATEVECFSKDHLFIHQLEMAGVTQLTGYDLSSTLEFKER